MRSSKSRSRSKSNRPRSIGNIINRVFDSSGPEGKVRGTPQQIIEKYQILARDAQLSNDRVAAENFMQHAEHYTRMLAEAQRELAAEQEQRRPQDFGQNSGNVGGQGQNGQQGQNGGQGGYAQGGQQGGGQNRDRPYRDDRPDPRFDPQPELAPVRSASMMDFIEEISDSGLVETPETRRVEGGAPRNESNERRDRAPRPERGADLSQERRPDRPDRRDDRKPRGDATPRPEQHKAPDSNPAQVEAPVAEDAPTSAPRRSRPPRKPRAGQTPGDDTSGPAEAAE